MVEGAGGAGDEVVGHVVTVGGEGDGVFALFEGELAIDAGERGEGREGRTTKDVRDLKASAK